MSKETLSENEKIIIEAYRQGRPLEQSKIINNAMRIYERNNPGYMENRASRTYEPGEEESIQADAETESQ